MWISFLFPLIHWRSPQVIRVLLQVECHPYLNQSKLLEFCKARGIVLTAYSPLGSPGILARSDTPAPLKDPKIIEIAKKRGKTAAQIILRYLVRSNSIRQSRDVAYVSACDRKLSFIFMCMIYTDNNCQLFCKKKWHFHR